MRYHYYRIRKFIKKIVVDYDISNDKSILDVGSQDVQYKKHFKILKYYALDILVPESGGIDIVSDLNRALAIKNESFDYILCTQVLEHIKEPHNAIREFNRVLKKGGKVFLTTHMCYDEHMVPHDYFRYTKYGLRYLAESNGFNVVSISPHGGVFITLSVILDSLIPQLFFKSGLLYYLYYVFFTVPIFFLNLILRLLDYLDREKTLTVNYECIFCKK